MSIITKKDLYEYINTPIRSIKQRKQWSSNTKEDARASHGLIADINEVQIPGKAKVLKNLDEYLFKFRSKNTPNTTSNHKRPRNENSEKKEKYKEIIEFLKEKLNRIYSEFAESKDCYDLTWRENFLKLNSEEGLFELKGIIPISLNFIASCLFELTITWILIIEIKFSELNIDQIVDLFNEALCYELDDYMLLKDYFISLVKENFSKDEIFSKIARTQNNTNLPENKENLNPSHYKFMLDKPEFFMDKEQRSTKKFKESIKLAIDFSPEKLFMIKEESNPGTKKHINTELESVIAEQFECIGVVDEDRRQKLDIFNFLLKQENIDQIKLNLSEINIHELTVHKIDSEPTDKVEEEPKEQEIHNNEVEKETSLENKQKEEIIINPFNTLLTDSFSFTVLNEKKAEIEKEELSCSKLSEDETVLDNKSYSDDNKKMTKKKNPTKKRNPTKKKQNK